MNRRENIERLKQLMEEMRKGQPSPAPKKKEEPKMEVEMPEESEVSETSEASEKESKKRKKKVVEQEA